MVKFYIYGHWHIAFCALLFYVGGCAIFQEDMHIWTGLHIFCATQFIYTLHRYFSADKMNSDNHDRYEYFLAHQRFALIILVYSGLLAVFTFFFIPFPIQITLLLSGIVSIGYILPLVFRRRLRDLGMAKIFLISIVWAVLPIIPSVSSGISWISFLVFAEHFFFIFALTIPFDVRDQRIDQRTSVSNLANKLGLHLIQKLILFCILFSVIGASLSFSSGIYSASTFLATFCFYILLFISIRDLKKPRSEFHYLFYLDGFIILKGGILCLHLVL